jgi:hypothetical protein
LKTLWKWDEHKGMFWQVITQGAQVMRKMGVVENVVQVQAEKQSNERSGKAIAVNS